MAGGTARAVHGGYGVPGAPGSLDLAIADGAIKRNLALSEAVDKPSAGIGGKVVPWTDARVAAVTDAHPGYLRLVPELLSGLGLRIMEALALSLEVSTLTRAWCTSGASSTS